MKGLALLLAELEEVLTLVSICRRSAISWRNWKR